LNETRHAHKKYGYQQCNRFEHGHDGFPVSVGWSALLNQDTSNGLAPLPCIPDSAYTFESLGIFTLNVCFRPEAVIDFWQSTHC
jgi:hypothetical protein